MSTQQKNYADTDFFLALIKDDDWLAPQAKKLYHKLSGTIFVTPFTVVELIIVCYRERLPVQSVLVQVSRIALLDDMQWDIFFDAAKRIEQGATPFDALLMAWVGTQSIISSDAVHKKFSLKTHTLRPQ